MNPKNEPRIFKYIIRKFEIFFIYDIFNDPHPTLFSYSIYNRNILLLSYWGPGEILYHIFIRKIKEL